MTNFGNFTNIIISKFMCKTFFNKSFFFFLLLLLVVLTTCKEKNNTRPEGGTETGLYMGIIGFNDNIFVKGIDMLNNYRNINKRDQYRTFVNNLTMRSATGLYYAVDNAINMLQAATLPNDLENVSIVTFTDGLDNFSIELNTNYKSKDSYRDAIRNRISNTKIKNLNISAYSIGVRGGDVVDIDAFKAGISALASHKNNLYEVTNMNEINEIFVEIATSLNSISQSQSIKLRIPGGFDDGARIRFTFDDISDADSSKIYVEGIFKRSGTTRSLQDIVYEGFNSSSGTSVIGELIAGYVTFTFVNVLTDTGDNVDTKNTKQWEYITSESRWQKNSEFGQTGDTEIIEVRKSAVIILVLDCTSSLDANEANGFRDMKSAVNDFIDTLTQ